MIELGVLGSMTFRRAGVEHPIPGGILRRLIGLLLARANQPASLDMIVDEIWFGRPPENATSVLRVHVSRLRRLFGDDDRIQTHPGAYSIVIGPDEFDAALFGQLVMDAAESRSRGDVHAARAVLREALGLWRGQAFDGLTDLPTISIMADQLNERRLSAFEDVVALDLDAGRLASVIAELPAMIDAHPYRERMRGQYMLALYRTGRRTEALAAYRQIYDVLTAEMGLEPGQELRHMHRAILSGDPTLDGARAERVAVRRVPRMLPAAITNFVGRVDDVAWLDQEARSSGAMIISAIAGTGGVGKTALALHWAHRESDQFPDGQLYIDLRGYHPAGPMDASEALGALLSALDIADDRVPHDVEQAAALYRSTIANRQMLIMLDNARHVGQVRPLLPGDSRATVIVTSRHALSGLVARDAARRLTLDTLPSADSAALLTGIIGHDRAEREPDALDELCDLCAHLPLALRIAGVHLADRPTLSIGAYAERLRRENRIAELAVDDDPRTTVESVFHESYADLPESQQRAFRLLGLSPSTDVTLETATALFNTDPSTTSALLGQLCDSHLVIERTPGRFMMHDLLREFAAQLAMATDDDELRKAAVRRQIDSLLGRLEAAHALLYPTALHLPIAGTPCKFADRAEAMDWLTVERHTISATVDHATMFGPLETGWMLVSAIRPYLLRVRATAELERLAQAALRAAETVGDVRAQAAIYIALADASLHSGQLDKTIEAARACVDTARLGDWPEARVGGLNALGLAYSLRGDLHQASRFLAEAIGILDSVDVAYRRSITLQRQGVIFGLLGDLPAATAHMERAVEHSRAEQAGAFSVAVCLQSLVVIDRLSGRHDRARAHALEARELNTSVQADHGIAIDDGQLAKIMRDCGELDEAFTTIGRVLDALAATTDQTTIIHARLTRGTILAEMGRWSEAAADLDDALGLARRMANRHNVAESLIALGLVCLGQNDHHAAMTFVNEAHDIAVVDDFRLLQAQSMAVMAEAHRRSGNCRHSDELDRSVNELYTTTGHRQAPCPVSWLQTVSWP